MNENMLPVLEFPKILQRLADHTAFSASRELALALRPATDPEEVRRGLDRTTEARNLLGLRPNVTVGGARDVRPAAQRAALGGVLQPADFLQILTTLQAGQAIRNVVLRLGNDVPLLAEIAGLIVDCPSLEADLARCFDERGELRDQASPTLARIRGELKIAHQRLTETLQRLITSTALRPLLQEPIVTVRDGRYVVPVRVESKSQFRGIIHDQSASGQTVYMEPLAIVDLNNRWRQLQLDEQQEIDRILRELSGSVGAVATTLVTNVEALAELDLALAKARLADQQRAIAPAIADGPKGTPRGCLRLVNARHPLIGPSCVPITVSLGDDHDVLIVTGPNTGGKTVALKTVGLLALMAQAGLHIPADEGSQIRVFSGVYADIGDEQSIEQSLSTFSSHMTRIVAILGEADDDALILLDEVGAGTDPTEGSALARAILGHFLERGIWAIVTTHYNELKVFAHSTPRVQNASVEFDSETLAPTYRLIVGVPGRSNALAIAERLGLHTSLIERARASLDPTNVAVDELLAGIQEEREKAEAERQVAESERKRVVMLRRQLERRLDEIDAERQAAAERAYEEALAELGEIRARLRESASALERTTSRSALAPAVQQLRDVERALAERRPKPRRTTTARSWDATGDDPRPLRPGDAVLIRSLNQTGELVAILEDRGQADVQVGNFKMRANLLDLERARHQASPEPAVAQRSSVSLLDRPTPSTQLDLRGWRADEVGPALEQYLNDAFLAGLPWVRIVHGKGTGVLRQVVREILSSHSLVRSHAPAPANEGGEGATVATLAH